MRRTTLALALFAMMTALGASKAQAALMKTYTYTGNTFDPALSSGSFVGSSITGSFTIDCGLAPSSSDCSGLLFDDVSSAITSFSFSAGGLQITDATCSVCIFILETSSVMEIITWTIRVETGVDVILSDGFASFPNFAFLDSAQDVIDSGRVVDDPGTWSFTTTTVPEPSSLAILLVGLAALVLLLARRRAGAAMAQEGRPLAQQLKS